MRHLAIYLLLQLGGNAEPSKEDVTKAMNAAGIEVDTATLDRLYSDIDGKSIADLMEEGKEQLAKFGSGGGGGGGGGGGAGGAAEAEAEKEEEPEEEEMAAPAMDMFGGGDEKGGDY